MAKDLVLLTETGIPLVPQSADPELNAMLAEIDPNRIQRIIQTLTDFGTRHTLSVGLSQNPSYVCHSFSMV